ncbi:MAG: sodium:proton antiporter, partial [Alistipes sp.]|nr:sodium:proton antiporter [Alistipes sp.]
MEAKVELWMLIPFGVMLLTIAVAPLLFEHWWEKNRNKLIFTLLLSIPTVAFLCWFGMCKAVTHQMLYD